MSFGSEWRQCDSNRTTIPGAAILGNLIATPGNPTATAALVTGRDLSPHLQIDSLITIDVIPSTTRVGFPVIAITPPLLLPRVGASGPDNVWFGVLTVPVVEMAKITAPVARNHVVIRAISGRTTN